MRRWVARNSSSHAAVLRARRTESFPFFPSRQIEGHGFEGGDVFGCVVGSDRHLSSRKVMSMTQLGCGAARR